MTIRRLKVSAWLLAGCAVWVAIAAGAAAETDVWLDVDAAAGLHERDVDDALAMIQAFHSPELVVRGVSAVYGNAPLADGLPIAREVVERFGPEGLRVHPGASGKDELGEETEAVAAMARALREGPLTLLALGPLTNVGSLLRLHPEVQERIEAIVMVAARRPGQRFTYPEATQLSFPDFNFENDPDAMAIILDTEIDLVFAPWEVSSHVWIVQGDLDALAASGRSGAWIAEKTASWIAMWRNRLELGGFNPFDTLAVGWVTHPGLMQSMAVGAWIEEVAADAAVGESGAVKTKPQLLVDAARKTERTIVYLYRPWPGFKGLLLSRLAGAAAK